jgi:hypothetical protein
MDDLGQEVYVADVEHSTTPGIATFVIPSADVDYLTPQYLRYVVYVLNDDDTKNIIYGDTQFGATGTMQLIGTAQVIPTPEKIIKTFTALHSTIGLGEKTYYSESVDVNPRNDINLTADVAIEFKPLNLDAEIKVQITYDKVVHTATNWETVETFSITNSTSTVTKTYSIPTDFTDEVNWLRITYIEATENTGKFDRVIVR